MTFRTRCGLVAGAWAASVGAALIVVPLAFQDRLPDPLASHWGPSGAPDNSAPLPVLIAISASLWFLIVVAVVGFASRDTVFRRRSNRAWMGAALGWGAVFVLGLTALTVWANLDVPGWKDARALSWHVLVVIGLSLPAGWLGWLLARRGPDEPPEHEGRQLPSLRLKRGERAVWVSSACSSALLGLSAAFLAVSAVLAIAMVVGLPSWLWIAVAATGVSGVAGLTLSSVRVHVTDQGIAIAFGPLRTPVRRVSVHKIDSAWAEQRRPSQVGGWGYRGLPGNATIMIRGGDCLIIRYRSGGKLGISVDDAEHGAALLNALIGGRSSTP